MARIDTYKVTIHDSLFNVDLSGDFVGFTEQQAIDNAMDFYMEENDTDGSDLEVISCKLIIK